MFCIGAVTGAQLICFPVLNVTLESNLVQEGQGVTIHWRNPGDTKIKVFRTVTPKTADGKNFYIHFFILHT